MALKKKDAKSRQSQKGDEDSATRRLVAPRQQTLPVISGDALGGSRDSNAKFDVVVPVYDLKDSSLIPSGKWIRVPD